MTYLLLAGGLYALFKSFQSLAILSVPIRADVFKLAPNGPKLALKGTDDPIVKTAVETTPDGLTVMAVYRRFPGSGRVYKSYEAARNPVVSA